MDQAIDFAVRRDQWRQHRVTTGPVPMPQAPGQVCFRIDRFALTSNNITYALIGDMLGYWTFFPAGGGRNKGLPGAEPAFFFAPSQLEKRTSEWGADGFQAKVAESWRLFVAFTAGWLKVVRGYGPDELARVYDALVAGTTNPAEGHVLSLWDAPR